SPCPPARPNGWFWQPAYELASGADRRLKLRGNNSGSFRSDNGAPVPLVSGLPPPSCAVQTALNSLRPCSIRAAGGSWYSSPSMRCLGTATSRPRSAAGRAVAVDATQSRITSGVFIFVFFVYDWRLVVGASLQFPRAVLTAFGAD